MNIDLERFRGTFFEEAVEHLATIESGLLRLESTPHDRDLLNEIFRAAHSMKGSSGMFGLHDLTHFTHAMENVLDRLRNGALLVTRARINLLLRSADLLQVLVTCARNESSAPPQVGEVTAELIAETGEPASAVAPSTSLADRSSESVRYRISLRPTPEFLLRGQDPLLLFRDLATLGELSDVAADVSALPSIDELDAETCYVAWSMTLTTARSENDIRDVFMFVNDICEIGIEQLPFASDVTGTVAVVADPRSGGDRRVAGQGEDRRVGGQTESSSIRVSTEKVDEMINLVGELVISHSMVSQLVSHLDSDRTQQLEEAVAEMGRNMRDLQERVLKIRMLPVSSVFNRFPRLVRDIAMATGKLITLEMSGEETELDKGVIERIADPLTHLIRNAADHGIEMPDIRSAAGKPEYGTISLAASHRGGNVIIEISDDGPGLAFPKIRDKAIALGLLRADEPVTDEQLQGMIFHAGFSTAATVTDVSGRGVGMDVVRRNVESLSGSISIESAAGRGTRFIVKLPLTLAILDGMALAVGSQVYVLPLLSIIESFRASPSALTNLLGQGEVVRARGETVPLVRLHRVLGIQGAIEDPCRALIVLVEHDGRRYGLMVDELLGQSQVVIRSLEANFRRVDGVMGATILGDGQVALILDVQGVTRLAGRNAFRVEPQVTSNAETFERSLAVV